MWRECSCGIGGALDKRNGLVHGSLACWLTSDQNNRQTRQSTVQETAHACCAGQPPYTGGSSRFAVHGRSYFTRQSYTAMQQLSSSGFGMLHQDFISSFRLFELAFSGYLG
jgi:hypothetical protein